MTTDPQSTQTESDDIQATEPETETIATEASTDAAATVDESESVDAAASDEVGTVDLDSTPAAEPLVLTSESRNWATFAHLSAFVMFLGIPSLIGPLVVWLAKKDDPYVEAQAKEALNFNISMLIYAIVAGISILLVIGIIALPAVFIAWFVLVIVAAIKAADGEDYRYPFTIRLVS
jgi:uncharacterized Tic20 family protein